MLGWRREEGCPITEANDSCPETDASTIPADSKYNQKRRYGLLGQSSMAESAARDATRHQRRLLHKSPECSVLVEMASNSKFRKDRDLLRILIHYLHLFVSLCSRNRGMATTEERGRLWALR